MEQPNIRTVKYEENAKERMKNGKDHKPTQGVYRKLICDECGPQYCMRGGHNERKPVKHNRITYFSHKGYSNKQNKARKNSVYEMELAANVEI